MGHQHDRSIQKLYTNLEQRFLQITQEWKETLCRNIGVFVYIKIFYQSLILDLIVELNGYYFCFRWHNSENRQKSARSTEYEMSSEREWE